MKFIAHRVNTVEELRRVPEEYGVEIDLRDRGDRLIMQHDPFRDGEDFEDFLPHYRHGTLILNIKSERIEHRVTELLRHYHIEDYFFLDSSFPMIYLLSGQGERRIALRFSELESIESVLAMAGRVDWVWIDCFTRLPVTWENAAIMKDAGFRLCLVSPELQGREADIPRYRDYLLGEKIMLDAICTKLHNIELWKGMVGGGEESGRGPHHG